MRIYKTRNVKTPERGTSSSAGLDFFVPDDFPGEITLLPGDAAKIPSGIKAEIPKGYALIFHNKSGVATKKGLQVGADVVDEDYQGEIHLHVRNITADIQFIKPGEKLVQALLVPVFYDKIEVLDSEEELFPDKTQRGDGGFGSTGNGLE